MKRTVLINIVGLSQRLLDNRLPFLTRYFKNHQGKSILPAFPAVTTTAQYNYLTGKKPGAHGIVGNGWYDRTDAEIKFWKQSNHLVQAPKIWEELKRKNPNIKVANLFWWYNMYSDVDIAVTPRPNYLADGRKFPDIYTMPKNLRNQLQDELGTFPLFHFWGPKTSIKSSQWIADCAKKVELNHQPDLSLVYLPHLDYGLQKYGPDHPKMKAELLAIDQLCQDLFTFFENRGLRIIALSEYGITPVNKSIAINRHLRLNGWLETRMEKGQELLDPGASKAFAVADHQVAHLYIKKTEYLADLKNELMLLDGVEKVMDKKEQEKAGLCHERSGDLLLVANANAWFNYYYWFDDKKAPLFAKTVDIHRKPGYDPVELFMDSSPLTPIKVAGKLLAKKLGFRTLLNVIPINETLVKGSHGRIPESKNDWPVLFSNDESLEINDHLESTDVFGLLQKAFALNSPTTVPEQINNL
ncbi:alkaline phosphatase family protein [Persicobacter sp. CCB-QB2]|uniref:alkaline phosphatase family protein n=1 Tax=Persicobacter sp. CCB-QB2 TaxID=1561025 RepID=UPI0006A9EEB0|nr:nucleotide pyrophosphatase/phosphodiesterase family protein [Persicobacter sp. CCB-QB2]